MTLTFIDEPNAGAAPESEQTNDWLAANSALNSVLVPAPEPEFNLPPEDPADTGRDHPAGSSQPDPGRQMMFGRYIGQITARIERAWTRPRTPIDDTAFFACRVRVTQHRRGIVQQIELVRCNGTPRWQTSLVQAIQSASPLPAPPDADVYTSQIVLDMQSATFTPGSSAEGFEPDVSAVRSERKGASVVSRK